MSFTLKHPLKTQAVPVFAGLAGIGAGVTAWLTDDLEPWLHAGVTGVVALVVASIAWFLVWAQRSVDELQGNHLSDDEVIAERAEAMNAASPPPALNKIEAGQTIHISDG